MIYLFIFILLRFFPYFSMNRQRSLILSSDTQCGNNTYNTYIYLYIHIYIYTRSVRFLFSQENLVITLVILSIYHPYFQLNIRLKLISLSLTMRCRTIQHDVEQSKQLFTQRIHVERVTGHLKKKYTILK